MLMLRVVLCFCVILVCGSASAASRNTLRVMTYNIHTGVGIDKRLDLERIAKVINRVRPDLVGLQEIDRGVERTNRRDEIAELAKLTRMEYAFAPNLRYQGGWYGVAVLSRYPILGFDHRRFLSLREAERRGYLRVEVAVDGELLNFVTTHLDYKFADGRLFETEQLLKDLTAVKTPLIVVGDFNDEPTGSSYELMLTRFADAWSPGNKGGKEKSDDIKGNSRGLTYPADKPTKRIDYIFYRDGESARHSIVKRAWTIDTTASDHLPIVAEIECVTKSDEREPSRP